MSLLQESCFGSGISHLALPFLNCSQIYGLLHTLALNCYPNILQILVLLPDLVLTLKCKDHAYAF